jgi:thiol peroxidase
MEGRREGFVIAGTELAVQHDKLVVGAAAPDFRMTANNWAPRTLADYRGFVKVVSVVPSVDTSVCSAQMRRFNEAASALGERVVVLGVSADLPYAQSRWCAAEGIARVETLSDHKDMLFSDRYGVHVRDARLCQRAVFVVGADDRVAYAEYVPNIDFEVNFAAVLEAAAALI